jgi:hypothetical protein
MAEGATEKISELMTAAKGWLCSERLELREAGLCLKSELPRDSDLR